MSPRVFVVVPVYNERGTVEDVLSKLHLLDATINEVVVVEDGSSDGSSALIDRWARCHQNVTVLRHDANRGYSQALLTGFNHLLRRLERGEVSDQDVVATIDADGQHDPLEIPRLLQVMQADSLDVVWAQRDFSLYPCWKRVGNRIMSLIARLFSGYPFRDVETGYCLFRIGALAAALQYRTRHWRYSISLSLAVILTRLGFRLSNEPQVSVPLYRSRTRVLDVFTDTLAAANAWAAVTFAPLRHSREARFRFGIGLVTALGLGLVVSLIAVKPIFLGYDSINNYVHVRFIASNLYRSGSIPLRIPWLEGGQAVTYPYAFFPWTLAALLYPAFGDYAVTWTMLLGLLLMILVVHKTRLRSDPWLSVLFLLHPLLLQGLLSFQLAFIWGSLFAYLYISALERNARWRTWLWWVLALSTHLLIVGALLAIYNLLVWFFCKERRKLVLWVTLFSSPILAPVAWYTLQTPSVGSNTPMFLSLTALGDVLIRGSLFFSPFLLVKGKQLFAGKAVAAPSAAFLLVLSICTAIPFGGFSGLVTQADNPYEDFLASASFRPGATYRVLEASDREQGHYFFVQGGAVLSHELFSESQVRRSWEPSMYECFLAAKGIDYVVINREYNGMFHTNEEQVLENMAAEGVSQLTYADPHGRFRVFDVREVRQDTPVSVRDCFER